MKRTFVLSMIIIFFSCISVYSRTLYSCFLSQDYNFETGEVTNQITNNSLIDIYLDGNKLYVASKVFSMYNLRETNNGFINVKHYDAIDGQNQRCQIKFVTDSSGDWATRNAIIIWYNEISTTAKWYQSRDPQIK